ncbi:MAG TPA: endonuclease VIII [Gammaproteobacteria bacterium]|nr:endonuclease VIII [Gammaproteobacteria bacterium]
MPEGPEIKRIADELAAALAGRKITRVFFTFKRLHRYRKKLTGAKIIAISARSKAIITRLDNGLSIYSHNQLYGRWQILPEGDYPQSSRSLRLAIHTKDTMALLYSASDIEVLETGRLSQHPYLKKLGPELLDENTTTEDIISRFEDTHFHRRALAGLLQDQSFIAGMGNYLCCEALYISGIYPAARLADLDRKQRERLARNCLKLTRQSYRTGGITNQLKRANALRKQGVAFEDYRFYVYRRDGLPCYQCGATIIKERFAGKTAYLCPQCQPVCSHTRSHH